MKMKEECLVKTKKDVDELHAIMLNQIKKFGPFVLTFDFPDEVEE